jgi:uncharacterized protein
VSSGQIERLELCHVLLFEKGGIAVNLLSFLSVPAVRRVNKVKTASEEVAAVGVDGNGDEVDGAEVDRAEVDGARVAVRQGTTSNGTSKKSLQFRKAIKKSVRLFLIAQVASFFGIYLALYPPFAPDIYQWMLFHPGWLIGDSKKELKRTTSTMHCHYSDVFFAAPDGARLHAWYFVLPGSTKTILLSHGSGGPMEFRLELANLLLKSGFSVFMYDYEGFGKSSGKPSLQNICDDGVAAFDYLVKQKRIRAIDIVLYGESLGTGVSCEISKQRQAGGIILQSGFSSLIEAGRDVMPLLHFYPDSSFPTPNMNSVATLRGPHPPLLLIHGKKDNLLSYKNSETLMKEAMPPKRLVLLPDATHDNICHADVPETTKALKTFLSDLNQD